MAKEHTSVAYFGEEITPIIYVRSDDSTMDSYLDYADKYKAELFIFNAEYLGINYVSQTYDLIIKHAIDNGFDRLFMTDDDISFMTNNPIPGLKPDFSHCSPYEFKYFLDEMSEMLGCGIVACAPVRIESRTHSHIINFNSPARVSVMWDVNHLKKHPEHRYYAGIEMEAHCDSNLSMKILTDGFMTANITAVYTSTLMNNPGGCSTYRTLDLQEKATALLHEKYPTFTRLKQKKGWADDPDIMILGITCYWKKAFNKAIWEKRENKSATEYARQLVKDLELSYSEHIKRMRHEYNTNK